MAAGTVFKAVAGAGTAGLVRVVVHGGFCEFESILTPVISVVKIRQFQNNQVP